MVKLQKACRNYSTWKQTHSPELKPWLHPDQSSLPAFNPADIGKWDLTALPVLDERDAVEAVATSDGADENDASGVPVSTVQQLATAEQATGGGQPTVEQIAPDVSMAMTEPATPDTAVAAGAN